MLRNYAHPWKLLLLFMFTVLLIGAIAAPIATATPPKWFVREGLKGESELKSLSSVGLNQYLKEVSIKIRIYEEGPEGGSILSDACPHSRFEGIKAIGGSPGTAKINKVVITGCEEAISSLCHTFSPSEEFIVENLNGELVYDVGAPVYLLLTPTKQPVTRLNLNCGGLRTTLEVTGRMLAALNPTDAFSEFSEDSFSSTITNYKNNSTGATEEAVLKTFPGKTILTNIEAKLLQRVVSAPGITELKVE